MIKYNIIKSEFWLKEKQRRSIYMTSEKVDRDTVQGCTIEIIAEYLEVPIGHVNPDDKLDDLSIDRDSLWAILALLAEEFDFGFGEDNVIIIYSDGTIDAIIQFVLLQTD